METMQIHHRVMHHARRAYHHVREKVDPVAVGVVLIIFALFLVLAYQFGVRAGRQEGVPATVETEPKKDQPVLAQQPKPDIFITATSTEVRTLRFFAPKVAEVVKRGEAYTLKWEGIGYEGYAAADITLQPADEAAKAVSINDGNAFIDFAAGVYQWNVPADLVPGTYKLALTIMRIFKKDDAPMKIAEAQSPRFLVVE